MDTRRVLYFLNLLSENTSGHSAELADLYTRALNENDEIRQLKSLYENCAFYGELGRSTSRSVEKKLKDVYTDVPNALDYISDIRIENAAIKHEIAKCDDLMHSPYPFQEAVSVLRKNKVPGYVKALTSIAASCAYMLILYNGPDAVKYLRWEDTAGIREKLYAVNTKFLPAVMSIRRPGYYWVIRKKYIGGKAFFGGYGYSLSYEPARDVDTMARGYITEPLGTHAYLNTRAFDNGEIDVPLCWGIGHLTSVTPANALQALGKALVTDLRTPVGSELSYKMPSPAILMNHLADRRHYCITADKLVNTMNQWQTGHEIAVRKSAGRCLFCGRPLRKKSTLVCPEHFNI